MKKLLFSLLCVCAVLTVQAEQFAFITLLSEPVGVFSTVEVSSEADKSVFAEKLNFCNTKTAVNGTINLQNLTAHTLRVENSAATLQSVPQNALSKVTSSSMTLNKKGSSSSVIGVTGGVLNATNVLYSSGLSRLHLLTADNKTISLSSENPTFAAGDFNRMTITDKAVFDEPANSANKNLAQQGFEWKKVGEDACQAAGRLNCSNKLLVGDMSLSCDDYDYRFNNPNACCEGRPKSDDACYEYQWEMFEENVPHTNSYSCDTYCDTTAMQGHNNCRQAAESGDRCDYETYSNDYRCSFCASCESAGNGQYTHYYTEYKCKAISRMTTP